ncbi:hypothetical protein HBI56_174430 [Parastagonospora nodorum]|nr:hypothetical protein HBH56_119900 [Parastagonospora nodorum]KAH3924192.1 hypothetical protein HBH54_195800 [Parastagonospora nodorum]KAH3968446.1 hypothetical protein HBH52_178250 [Parastagonospora nodorum]KAH4082654.1 hypothetical protein HBH48_181510 [Parastagonospora nodorum]KAH4101157.1 hypothetical protein HBH46_140950 [Parastagonospora nodorum]
MTLVTVFWCPQTRHQSDSSVSSNLLRGCPWWVQPRAERVHIHTRFRRRRCLFRGRRHETSLVQFTTSQNHDARTHRSRHEPHVVCEAVIAAHRQKEVVHTESFIFANVITIPQDKLI